MIRTIEQLCATPDSELIAEHDDAAKHTSVGTGYYVEELSRRETLRAMEASNKLARASFYLTIANAVFALSAVVVAFLV